MTVNQSWSVELISNSRYPWGTPLFSETEIIANWTGYSLPPSTSRSTTWNGWDATGADAAAARLQSVLMARQDITSVVKKQPNESLERALTGLRDATEQMREATFELHPAVLGGAGVARALQQLAAANSARSGIDITTDIDYPVASPNDPILFAAARELISNVVRHSRATRASVTLRAADGVGHLDVVDDGVGMSDQEALRRLEQGHIGIASQRARIEAAGGALRTIPVPTGTHIEVTVPMKPPATGSVAGG